MRGLALIGLPVILSACVVGGDDHGSSESNVTVLEGGTIILEEGELDPRVPATKEQLRRWAEASDLPPSAVLVYGDLKTARDALSEALSELGNAVTNVQVIPSDLSPFDNIFRVSAGTPVDLTERELLKDFLALGRGLHLSGERPCSQCTVMNDSLTLLLREVLVASEVVVGRQGDILPPPPPDDMREDRNLPLYPVNTDAKGEIAVSPNEVAEGLLLAKPGGVGGITAADNVLAVGRDDAPVGGIWYGDDLVDGKGRLVLLMDVNWVQSLGIGDNLDFLENLQRFTGIGVPPADDDGDGVPADTDCDDGDDTVGALLFEDDFAADIGFFAPTEQLSDPWGFDGEVTFAQVGGQQAQIGAAQEWTDVVVFATISARGTQNNCGHGSGQTPCGDHERWRAGVVARAQLDADQDEGYHGYRCALSSNATNGCYEDGLFLQIAEFMDAPEDDIASECKTTCLPNTTFDQHGRQNHDIIDLSKKDSGLLTFYVVGPEMYCEARNQAGDVVAVSGYDDSFKSGTIGLSTLNIFGEFDDIRVCEALALP